MSLFCRDANVTGTDRTVTVGVYPMLRSNSVVSAVVAVTSVQPTSENRTVRQAGASAPGGAPAATRAAPMNGAAKASANAHSTRRAPSGA